MSKHSSRVSNGQNENSKNRSGLPNYFTLKALLFGASGQLGNEWQHAFKNRDDFQMIPYPSSQLDITRPESVEDEISRQKPDVIINCAAYTKVDKAEKEKDKARQINAGAVARMADICASRNIKLVHYSTDYIFAGSREDGNRFSEGYSEDHTADPVNWYGQTKWEGEESIRTSGCRHLILRVSWLCGRSGTNFVKTMLRLAQKHDSLNVVNDQLGSPTYADNLVQNTIALINQDQEGTFHCSSAGIISWADFAIAIFSLSDKKVTVNAIPSSKYPTEAVRPFFSKLNTDKIQSVKGTKTEHWKRGLARLLGQIN